MGLVLTRKPGETIVIEVSGETILLTVGRCRKCDTRFRIQASEAVVIYRQEAVKKAAQAEDEE